LVGGFDAAELGEGFVEGALGGEAHSVETGDGGFLAEGESVGRSLELFGGAVLTAGFP
jgi:hypothetical protein